MNYRKLIYRLMLATFSALLVLSCSSRFQREATETIVIDEPTVIVDLPAGHSQVISASWPSDVATGFWPPNHAGRASGGWPLSEAGSQGWPARHEGEFSGKWPEERSAAWPPQHTPLPSNTWPDDPRTKRWPPTHSNLPSLTWPTDHRYGWPADHQADISRQWSGVSSRDWPANHKTRPSLTWPWDDRFRTRHWPPNHLKSHSAGWGTPIWPPDHAEAVSNSWPAQHPSGASSTWPDNADAFRKWPPHHRNKDSVTWPDGARVKHWPPQHPGAISLTWPDTYDPWPSDVQWPARHHGSFSDQWPREHRASPSDSWPNDPERTKNWPPRHWGNESAFQTGSDQRPEGSLAIIAVPDNRGTASIEVDLPDSIAVDEPIEVFAEVMTQLDDVIRVLPTENYLYFRFEWRNRSYWGNIRLSPVERDQGVVNFAYYPFRPNPDGPHHDELRFRKFSLLDGVVVSHLENLRYAIEFKGTRVILDLPRLTQKPPAHDLITASETWVLNAYDESGVGFHLLYDQKLRQFLWVLNEQISTRNLQWEKIGGWLVDRDTRFAFVDDRRHKRKLLVGVDALNIKQNNYYDGPFDQLPDNSTDHMRRLVEYIYDAYPVTRNHLDAYARYLDTGDSRVAITPYLAYETVTNLDSVRDHCYSLGSFESTALALCMTGS